MIITQTRNKKLASFIFKNSNTNSNLVLETRNQKTHIRLNMKMLRRNSIILFIPDEINEDDLTIKLDGIDYPIYYKDKQVEAGGIWEKELFAIYWDDDKINLLYFNTGPEDIDILAKTFGFF